MRFATAINGEKQSTLSGYKSATNEVAYIIRVTMIPTRVFRSQKIFLRGNYPLANATMEVTNDRDVIDNSEKANTK